MNLAAIDDLQRRHPDLELVLVESGGDNLSATFSPELSDLTMYVMERDSKKMRGERPFLFTNLYDGVGLETIISFILERGMVPELRPEKLAEIA